MTASPYEVGVATADVTPPIGIFLAGYAGRDEPSDGIYHALRATCIAIQDTDRREPLLLVTIDWLGFYDRTADARRVIGERTGLPPHRILLTGTHTHTGPVLRKEMDARRHGVIDEQYIAETLSRLAEAAAQALENRQPARLLAGTGWCGISSSRRRPDGAGGVLFKPSLDAPHDHRVSVLAIDNEAGQLQHVLFSYACHPTSTGAIRQIGGDYVAFACDAIEQQHAGVTASFFQGCAGDQKVDARDASGEGYRKLEIDEVQAKGESLAAAVTRTLAAGDLTEIQGELAIEQQFVTITTDEHSDDELRAFAQGGPEYVQEWARFQLDQRQVGTPVETAFSFEVQTLRCGRDWALIALAGEMSVEYALRYREAFSARFRHVWTLGYANDMVGYVTVHRQLAEGGYEAVDNNRRLLYSGPFSADTEERISAAVARGLGGY